MWHRHHDPGRALGRPSWQLVGGHDPRVKVHAGSIDPSLAVGNLLEGASKSIGEGHRSVKMRLGRPTLAEHLAGVAAMRAHIGDGIERMADATEAWRIDKAIRATAPTHRGPVSSPARRCSTAVETSAVTVPVMVGNEARRR